MSYQEDIDKALVAHGAWKQRLNKAITDGKSEYQIAQVQVDNRCDFGKWLYSLPPPMRTSEHFAKVQRLHAEFHVEAARILDLALKGKKADASHALSFDGRYANLSGQLAMALGQWKTSLARP